MNNKRRWALVALILGSGVALLDGTVVNLALPWIGRDLNGGFSSLQWIVDGYALTMSALILIGGSLGDIFGRKKIYITGLIGFGAISLACGLSPTKEWLISLRIVQGIFAALLIPGALSIINTNFPKNERGAAIGLWSGWIAAFAALGPLAGGYILNVSSWRWIFFINIPIVVACVCLAIVNIEESRDNQQRRVDYTGAILIALSLAAVTYSLIEGPIEHWTTLYYLILAVGLVLSGLFVWWESRVRDPMVNLGLFKSRNFTGANIMTFAMYGALGGFIFSSVIYLQTKMHYSPIQAGLSLLPITLLMMTLSRRFGALSAQIGPRFFMTAGPLISALGMITLVNLKPGNSYWTHVLPSIILFGFGMTLLVAPLTSTVMSSVKQSSSGIASGINNAVSRTAGLLVVALLGLTGQDSIFRFSILLCAGLAASAGIASYFMIQNPSTIRS